MNFGQFVQMIENAEQNLHRNINEDIIVHADIFGDFSGEIVIVDMSVIETDGLSFYNPNDNIELSFDDEETMAKYLDALTNFSEKMLWEELEKFCDDLQMEATKWLK